MLGGVVSKMVNAAVVEALLPQSSVAVNTTVMVWVQVPDQEPGVLDHVTLLPHRSEAEAPPLLLSQATYPLLRSGLVPSHSALSSLAGISMLGGVVSKMVNVAVVEALLPQSSVAVNTNVMVWVQVPDQEPGALDHVTLLPHRSEAEAPPLEASHAI